MPAPSTAVHERGHGSKATPTGPRIERLHLAPESGVGGARRGKLGVAVSRPAELIERTLPVGILCLALIGVPVLVLEPAGLPRLRALEKELDAVTVENADSYREIDRLRVEVRELRDDPAAVERIARSELGMVRKSEVVFQFGK